MSRSRFSVDLEQMRVAWGADVPSETERSEEQSFEVPGDASSEDSRYNIPLVGTLQYINRDTKDFGSLCWAGTASIDWEARTNRYRHFVAGRGGVEEKVQEEEAI
jgi:hypothetical protein